MEASIIADKIEAEIKEQQKKGLLPSWLAEQLSLQISTLRDEGSPDCELIAFPGFFNAPSEFCLLVT